MTKSYSGRHVCESFFERNVTYKGKGIFFYKAVLNFWFYLVINLFMKYEIFFKKYLGGTNKSCFE